MAVQIRSLATKDKFSKAKKSMIHYIKVNKGNKKGAAEAIGGQLINHPGHKTGDFHIVLVTVVNGKEKLLEIETGDIVFRTNANKRWQVGTVESLKKRFTIARF